MQKQMTRAVLTAFGVLLLPFSGAVFLIRLLANWRRIRRADVVILPDQKLNFGNTVIAADMARRIYMGKRIFLLLPRESSHNPYLAVVWPDIDFYTFPRFALSFEIFSRHVLIPDRLHHDRMAGALTKWATGILAPKAETIGPIELRQRCETAEEFLPMVAARRAENPDDPMLVSMWFSNYHRLISVQPVPRLKLPDHLRELVVERLATARKAAGVTGEVKFCVFYSKYADGSIHHLNGSPIEDYLPAFERVVAHGYQIMATGDQPLPPAIVERFKGMVVDEKALSIDRHLFNMFAATEAEMFFGDNGGGAYFSSINKKHQLVMNSYPFMSAISNAWMFHMWAYYEDGRPVPYAELATTYAFYDPRHKIRIEPNTADDILDAVECFLDEIKNSSGVDGISGLAREWPVYSTFHMSNSKLSPAYERRLTEKLSQASSEEFESCM
jgi:putative glycosyltransferase (TIGR04372 family)